MNRIELYKGRPLKSLTKGKKSSGGRNHHGRITSSHRGGFAKRLLRFVDYKRTEFWGQTAEVVRIEYNPGATGHIALVKYENGQHRYILAPKDLKAGDKVCAGKGLEPDVGNTMALKDIPQGFLVHNVELYPGHGGQIAKAAGSYARIIGREGDYIQLKLRSGESRKFLQDCLATIGSVSNETHSNRVIGKAGINRHKGIRPHTRGIAKNAVDHPHGGRTNGGKVRSTPNGRPTIGTKTRTNKVSSYLIISRRSK